MLRAIKFYNKFMFKGYEINDIAADWLLSAELDTSQLPARQVPLQGGFRSGLASPKIASKSCIVLIYISVHFIFGTSFLP